MIKKMFSSFMEFVGEFLSYVNYIGLLRILFCITLIPILYNTIGFYGWFLSIILIGFLESILVFTKKSLQFNDGTKKQDIFPYVIGIIIGCALSIL